MIQIRKKSRNFPVTPVSAAAACIPAPQLALLLLASMSAIPCTAQIKSLPRLGEPVPLSISISRVSKTLCETGEDHHDPCATIHIRGDHDRSNTFVVAWDAGTSRITYIFSSTIVGDSEIQAGGLARTAGAPIAPFAHWLISEQWRDTATSLSGDAVWWAVMKPDPQSPEYCIVKGFVQSVYLHPLTSATGS